MLATPLLGDEFYRSDRTWYNYFTNKVCEFKLKDAEVVKTPVWRDDAEHPILSARRAMRLANTTLAAMVAMPAEWKFDAVTLEPWDDKRHWIYVVTFRHLTTSQADGTPFEARMVSSSTRPSTITIPVLLRGVAVEPTVTMPKLSKP